MHFVLFIMFDNRTVESWTKNWGCLQYRELWHKDIVGFWQLRRLFPLKMWYTGRQMHAPSLLSKDDILLAKPATDLEVWIQISISYMYIILQLRINIDHHIVYIYSFAAFYICNNYVNTKMSIYNILYL